jgi:hypothetical protein
MFKKVDRKVDMQQKNTQEITKDMLFYFLRYAK